MTNHNVNPKRTALIVIGAITLLIISVIAVFGYIQLNSLECDIGSKSTVGDFEVTGKFLAKNHIESLDQDCKVRDCLAFREQAELVGSLLKCEVKG